MANPLPGIHIPQEAVFVSPGSNIVLKAIWSQTNTPGLVSWMRCINNSFTKLDTRGAKYHECSCHGNTDTFELTINEIESSDEGVYRVDVKLPSFTLESKVITLYVLKDINAIGKEELNLLRFKECENIAKEALQITFDRYLQQNGTDLATHIIGHRHLLASKNSKVKLSRYQLEVLYPSDGSLVSSRKFDVSILYTLLRNTTNIKKPKNNWNNKPPLESIGEGDDVERIHLYRNSIAHGKNNLSDDEFEEKWFELTTAIDRLSKGTLRNRLCQLRNKTFEQEKITRERFYRKQNTTDPYTEIISKWQSQDKLFCKELRLVEKAFDAIKDQKLIIIIGGGGSGKTATARHCSLKLQIEGWRVIPIDDIREIKSNCIGGKSVFVFDDPLGSLGLDDRKMTDLELYRCTESQFFGHDNHKLVITCRKIVYNEAKPYHIFDNYSVVDIEDKDHALNNIEKRKLLRTYGIEKLVDVSSLEGATLMFPLNCYILFQNREELLKSGAPQKVLNLRGYVLNELDIMSRSEKTKVLYASLVLLMIANNNLTDEKLKNRDILNEVFIKCNIYDHQPHSREVREKLQHSENTYVIKTDFGFKFLHDSLFEIFAFHFGQEEENQILLLKYIDIEYLANNTYMGDMGSPERDFQIRIFPNNYKILCHRLYHALQGIIQFDLDVRSVNPIFTHKCWRSEEFINILFKTTGKKNIVELFFKSHRVSKVKPKSSVPKRPSSWLHKQDLLENEKYGLMGIPWVSDGGETRLIDWIVFKGHLEFLQSVLSNQGTLDLFFRRKIEPDRLFWLSIYSMKEEMFTFALSEMKQNQIDRYVNALSYYFETPLTLACSLGAFEIVNILVESGADVEKCNTKDESPLLLAMKSGSRKIIKYLLEKRPLIEVENARLSPFKIGKETSVDLFKLILENCDVLSTNHDGKTPLHLAAEEGFCDVVGSLICRGANVNATDDKEDTPSHIACSKNNTEIVKLLLKAGAHFHALNRMNETPLDIALKNKSEDILLILLIELTLEQFKLLLEQSHFANKLTSHTKKIHSSGYVFENATNTILQNILRKCPLEKLKLILESCVIEGTIVDGKTPLHIAVEHGMYDVVETLIHHGANMNAKDNSCNTPLHIACYRKDTKIAKLLGKVGAIVNVFNYRDESPVSVAFNNASEELLQYFLLISPFQKMKELLEKCMNKDINCLDECPFIVEDTEIYDFREPTSIAVTKRADKILQGLLKTCPVDDFSNLVKYAQSSSHTSNGKTPLHFATENAFLDIVESLISCGVYIDALDANHQTPLHIACTLNDTEAVQLVESLIQHGANIDAVDSENQTPLHIACIQNNTKIAETLLHKLCITSIEDKKKRLPFHIVCERGNFHLAELLYEPGHLKRIDIFGKTPKCYAEGHASVQKVFNRRGIYFQFR